MTDAEPRIPLAYNVLYIVGVYVQKAKIAIIIMKLPCGLWQVTW